MQHAGVLPTARADQRQGRGGSITAEAAADGPPTQGQFRPIGQRQGRGAGLHQGADRGQRQALAVLGSGAFCLRKHRISGRGRSNGAHEGPVSRCGPSGRKGSGRLRGMIAAAGRKQAKTLQRNGFQLEEACSSSASPRSASALVSPERLHFKRSACRCNRSNASAGRRN